METKFKPGEKVKTISGNIGYVNSIIISVGYVIYSIWDGQEGYQNMDEWMVQKYEEDKIGFTENNS